MTSNGNTQVSCDFQGSALPLESPSISSFGGDTCPQELGEAAAGYLQNPLANLSRSTTDGQGEKHHWGLLGLWWEVPQIILSFQPSQLGATIRVEKSDKILGQNPEDLGKAGHIN